MHEVFKHAHPHKMAEAVKLGLWSGDTDITAEDILKVFAHYDCISCKLGKLNHPQRNLGSGVNCYPPGYTLSIDFVGPIHPVSYNGFKYFYHIVDIATGYSSSILVKSKKEFINVLTDVTMFYKRHNWLVKVIRVDADRLLISDEISTYLDSHQLIYEPAIPDEQNQNPVERYLQNLFKGESTLLHSQTMLSSKYWSLGLLAYNEQIISIPNTLVTDSTPMEVVTGNPPNIAINYKFSFGEPVIFKKSKHEIRSQSTFEVKNSLGVAICNADGKNGGTIVFKLDSKKLLVRGNMTTLKIPCKIFNLFKKLI